MVISMCCQRRSTTITYRSLNDGPVQSAQRHRHRVWQARMNRVHKQLAISCSADSSARLWYDGNAEGAQKVTLPCRHRRSASECEVVSYQDFEESVVGAN